MPVHFRWKDENKRAICYVAEGDWNWKDYHQAVRASAFTLTGVEHAVDCVIDLRGSTRATLPAGAAAHVRSFGRITQARLSGRAIVIGMLKSEPDRLQVRADGTLPTSDGFVRFVDTEAELDATLCEWAAERDS